MLSATVQSALDELNEIVRADGGELRVIAESGTSLSLDLDLTNSNCPECVLPKDLLLDILRARITEADPLLTEIELSDPREGAPSGPGH